MKDSFLYLDVFLIGGIIYLIIRKILGWKFYHEYKNNDKTIMTFAPNYSKLGTYIRYLFITIAVFWYIILIFNIIQGKTVAEINYFIYPSFFLYIGLLPNSSGYWLLMSDGIYSYISSKKARWKDIEYYHWLEEKKPKPQSPDALVIVLKRNSKIFAATQLKCLVPKKDRKKVEEYLKSNTNK